MADPTSLTLGLVSNPYHRGGITRWMVDLAGEWQRRGGRSVLVAPRPRAPFFNAGSRPTVIELVEGRLPAARPALFSPLVGPEFEFGTEGYRARIYAEAIRSAIPADSPLVTTDDPAAWRGAAAVADRYAFIGVMHSDEDHYYRLARRFGPQLRALVGVSRRITEKVRLIADSRPIPIVSIPCGTAPPISSRAAEGVRVARLMWAGRIDERQKRVSDLPRIARRLVDRGLDFKLAVIGDGPDRPMLEREIARLGVADCTRLLGWCEPTAVAAHLADSDILLLPSNFEGMPVIVMEALAAGCGVVASRISGIEDYERDERAQGCLWVHGVGDVTAAAEAVLKALAIPRAERRGRARQFATAEFSIDVCADRWAALVVSAVQVSPPPRLRERSLDRLARLVSYPVAAARIARLWTARRRRHGRIALQGAQ